MNGPARKGARLARVEIDIDQMIRFCTELNADVVGVLELLGLRVGILPSSADGHFAIWSQTDGAPTPLREFLRYLTYIPLLSARLIFLNHHLSPHCFLT